MTLLFVAVDVCSETRRRPIFRGIRPSGPSPRVRMGLRDRFFAVRFLFGCVQPLGPQYRSAQSKTVITTSVTLRSSV